MKKKLLLVMLCASSLLLSSCMTVTLLAGAAGAEAGEISNANKKFKKDWKDLTPDKYALLYNSDFSSFIMFQQNPEIGYGFYESEGFSVSKGGVIQFINRIGFLQPVPVNSEFALSEYSEYNAQSNTIYIAHGIQGVDLVVTKPGLCYMDFWDKDHSQELNSTKYLLKLVKGSAWESVVQKRIEELENEKK